MRAAALTALLGLMSSAAAAQEPAPLLEYPEGPVVNSNRVMGMGGAYVGVAEGADGHLYNPASFASRYPYTRNDFLDWDWSLYWLSVPGKRNPDLYGGRGETTETDWLGGGLDLKIAGFGAGFHVYTQGYELDVDGGTATRFVTNTSFGLGLAYALHTLDITLGSYIYGFVWAAETDSPTGREEQTLSTLGAGSRVGLLWAPRNRPVRIGLVYRSAFNASRVTVDDPTVFPAPDGVYLPGQISIGGAFMLWERHFNPNQTWGLRGLEDERLAEPGDEKRRYVMLAYDMEFKEPPPPGTLSMRGYLRNPDLPIPIRQEATIGFRGGVESEVWENWLVLRGGYYYEVARTDAIKGRHHGTAGFALRIPVHALLHFWPWDLRVDAAFDIALNYLNTGIGVGFWH